MDGEGIRKFLVDSSSEVATSRNEAPIALRCVADPAKLVLPWRTFIRTAMAGEIIRSFRQRDESVICSCNPCLLYCRLERCRSEAKNDAQKIAAAWKSKLNLDVVISPGEANVFLQFLLYYGISKEFHDDDIVCVLVVRISHLPEAPELCRALQISHKMPGWFS